ncbi:MAG: hypothetical protein J1E01_01325 [Acetatifactor sp.]|nr:hypothetical protein [Acetatifactor sp.]
MTREEILAVAKQILFNTDMVHAILDDRKTETRRKVEFHNDRDGLMLYNRTTCIKTPRYKVGDYLYVRETWTRLFYSDENGYTHYDQPMYYYAADGVPDITLVDADGFEEDDQRIRWRPSIHMPKEAARIFLRVTDIRVERLQDITEDGATKEGCINNIGFVHSPDNEYDGIHTAREQFITVWNSTIPKKGLAKYGWDANPWVWVIEFERVEGQ